MHQEEEFPYAEDDAVQVLELPYRGGDAAMVIVLPKAKDGLAAVEAALTADRLGEWLGELERRHVDVALPRFTLRASLDAKGALAALGVRRAFDAGQAEFQGMSRAARLSIGDIFHKAFVAVDEAGTEAAAATAVMMTLEAMPEVVEPVPFVADHPFLFLIRHRTTGAVLFLGRVAQP